VHTESVLSIRGGHRPPVGALLFAPNLAASIRRLLGTVLVGASLLCVGRVASASDEAPIPNCKETSEPAGVLTVTVDNDDGDAFGVLMMLIDYPEDLIFIPGAADEAEAQAVITDRPAGAQCVINDRNHELQVGCLSVAGFPEGRLFRVALRDCAGGEAAAPSRFTCRVLEAADTGAKKVATRCALKLS
jgi:hypothetical protein